jgi:hypothetical protein
MDYAFDTRGKPAVFLQHGVLASSLDWVLTGPHKALGEWRKFTSDYWVFHSLVTKTHLDQHYLQESIQTTPLDCDRPLPELQT